MTIVKNPEPTVFSFLPLHIVQQVLDFTRSIAILYQCVLPLSVCRSFRKIHVWTAKFKKRVILHNSTFTHRALWVQFHIILTVCLTQPLRDFLIYERQRCHILKSAAGLYCVGSLEPTVSTWDLMSVCLCFSQPFTVLRGLQVGWWICVCLGCAMLTRSTKNSKKKCL